MKLVLIKIHIFNKLSVIQYSTWMDEDSVGESGFHSNTLNSKQRQKRALIKCAITSYSTYIYNTKNAIEIPKEHIAMSERRCQDHGHGLVTKQHEVGRGNVRPGKLTTINRDHQFLNRS